MNEAADILKAVVNGASATVLPVAIIVAGPKWLHELPRLIRAWRGERPDKPPTLRLVRGMSDEEDRAA